MRKGNRPVYRRGREQCRRVNLCLSLLDQYHAGCSQSPRHQALAKMLEEELTVKELEYLRYYYGSAMTHRQIGTMLDRSSTTVSRSIVRAERKFGQVIERGASFWGPDFLDESFPIK